MDVILILVGLIHLKCGPSHSAWKCAPILTKKNSHNGLLFRKVPFVQMQDMVFLLTSSLQKNDIVTVYVGKKAGTKPTDDTRRLEISGRVIDVQPTYFGARPLYF